VCHGPRTPKGPRRLALNKNVTRGAFFAQNAPVTIWQTRWGSLQRYLYHLAGFNRWASGSGRTGKKGREGMKGERKGGVAEKKRKGNGRREGEN